jgi:uroporphyrinogen decarboxylase
MVLESKERLALPIMTHPGIDIIGMKVTDAVKNGEVHFNTIKALRDNFPSAAATMMMDLTVEAEAFGSKIIFSDDEIPSVSSAIVHNRTSIENLRVPLLQAARVPQYLKAAELAVDYISDRPVFAGCIGPFSLAGRLFDMSEMMPALYLDPELIKILIEKCAEFLLGYIQEYKKIGVNGIIMAEPAAGLLSADLCDKYSSKFIKKIVASIQDDQFLFILHNCGNTGHVTNSMVSTGAGGLHFGNKINILTVLNEVPKDILVLGNLDPVEVFKTATPDKVFDTTVKLLQATKNSKNFIISSGCDTPPGVSQKNIRSFFKAVQEFNSSL